MVAAIDCHGHHYRASTCKQCGVKMWPAQAMKVHQQLHRSRQKQEAKLKDEIRRNWTAIRLYWDY